MYIIYNNLYIYIVRNEKTKFHAFSCLTAICSHYFHDYTKCNDKITV